MVVIDRVVTHNHNKRGFVVGVRVKFGVNIPPSPPNPSKQSCLFSYSVAYFGYAGVVDTGVWGEVNVFKVFVYEHHQPPAVKAWVRGTPPIDKRY